VRSRHGCGGAVVLCRLVGERILRAAGVVRERLRAFRILRQRVLGNRHAGGDVDPAAPPPASEQRVEQLRKGAGALGKTKVSWDATGAEPVWQWVVQVRTEKRWSTEIVPGRITSRELSRLATRKTDLIALTAVDRCGNTSATTLIDITRVER
jgi:hypothetical protein